MTIQDAGRQLLFQLFQLYEEREAKNITDWVMENITGWTKIDRVINKTVPLSSRQLHLLETYTIELAAHKPVQYVLHEAWFYGMKLYVDENVLIPRPETEELVDWIVEEVRSSKFGNSGTGEPRTPEPGPPELPNFELPNSRTPNPELRTPEPRTILDIGTGSGCIALGLKKGLPGARVYGCDISEGALEVARRNAVEQHLDIELCKLDFLSEPAWKELPVFDILVSNPPYIPVRDKATMAAHVLNHEPHLALFVANNDPLQYYKSIAAFAKEHLAPAGAVYMEIYEGAGNTVLELFRQAGFAQTVLRKDLQGKNRMVKAAL